MGQILRLESISDLAIDSVTVISLPSSVITVGGQQFENESNLTMNTAVSGAGGLDTGAIAANTVYFVHAVNNSGAMALVSSLSETSPTGFTGFKKIGRFITNGSSEITSLATYIKEGITNWSTYTPWDFSPTATTAPTFGASPVLNRMKWKQALDHYLVEGDLELNVAGTNGAGEYTALLPGGIEIDTTKQGIGVGFGAGNKATSKGHLGVGSIANGGTSDGVIEVFAFSSTTIKFMPTTPTNHETWSSSYFQLSVITGVRFKIDFPGLGL